MESVHSESPNPTTHSAVCLNGGASVITARVSPSSGLEDEVGVGSAFRVLVARPALAVSVGRSWTLGEGLHHLCNMQTEECGLITTVIILSTKDESKKKFLHLFKFLSFRSRFNRLTFKQSC